MYVCVHLILSQDTLIRMTVYVFDLETDINSTFSKFGINSV